MPAVYVTRILSQAEREGVTLSETERRMLSWSGSDLDSRGLWRIAEAKALPSGVRSQGGRADPTRIRRDVAADKGTESLYREAEAKLDEDDHYISLLIYDAFHSAQEKVVAILGVSAGGV